MRMRSVSILAALGCLLLLPGYTACAQAVVSSGDPANLVINGGFEEINEKPWELKYDGQAKGVEPIAQISIDPSEHKEGGQSLRLDFLTDQENVYVVQQRFEITDHALASGPFRAMVSCKIKNTPGGEKSYKFGVSFSVKYEDGTSKWESGMADSTFDPTVSDWQTVDFIWTPQKPVSSVVMRVMIPVGAGAAWIDEAILVPLRN